MEKRQLVWSTSNNINTWFEKMKEELIVLGFACLPTTEEDVEGELVFLLSQHQRMAPANSPADVWLLNTVLVKPVLAVAPKEQTRVGMLLLRLLVVVQCKL